MTHPPRSSISDPQSSVVTMPNRKLKIPGHVAIIMDGNGRWAQQRGLSRSEGHKAGAENVKRVLDACQELGIFHLTLYAFSTENWNRPATEVGALMELLADFLGRFEDKFMENGIRLNAIGQTEKLPLVARLALKRVVGRTAGNTRAVLTLALNYGGRDEIVTAARALAEQAKAGKLDPEQITEAMFASHLFTATLPDPDLVIRTAGEMRLSNFLLWQSAYAEFVATPVLWPDFGRDEFIKAIEEYGRRERRFGGLTPNA